MKIMLGYKYYDAKDLMDIFGFKSRTSISELVSKGLKRTTILRKGLFREDHVQRFLENNTTKG